MRWTYLLIGAVLFGMTGMGLVVLADDATTQPAPEDMYLKHHKIPAPFNLLTDLTDDQKAQINKIHKDELEQEKALREQEQDNIMAVLTDDQRKELDDTMAKASLEKKAESAEIRARADEQKANELKIEEGGAATQPSGGQ